MSHIGYYVNLLQRAHTQVFPAGDPVAACHAAPCHPVAATRACIIQKQYMRSAVTCPLHSSTRQLVNRDVYSSMMKNTTTTMFRFLNQLRASGSINMFGASPVLAEVFGISPKEARVVLSHWMTWASQDPDNLSK